MRRFGNLLTNTIEFRHRRIQVFSRSFPSPHGKCSNNVILYNNIVESSVNNVFIFREVVFETGASVPLQLKHGGLNLMKLNEPPPPLKLSVKVCMNAMYE